MNKQDHIAAARKDFEALLTTKEPHRVLASIKKNLASAGANHAALDEKGFRADDEMKAALASRMRTSAKRAVANDLEVLRKTSNPEALFGEMESNLSAAGLSWNDMGVRWQKLGLEVPASDAAAKAEIQKLVKARRKAIDDEIMRPANSRELRAEELRHVM